MRSSSKILRLTWDLERKRIVFTNLTFNSESERGQALQTLVSQSVSCSNCKLNGAGAADAFTKRDGDFRGHIYIYIYSHIHTTHMLLHTSCCNIAQTQGCPSDLHLFASLNLCQDCNGDEEGNEEEQEELPELS